MVEKDGSNMRYAESVLPVFLKPPLLKDVL